MLTRILQRRLFNSAAPVLLYSSDFGSAALPAGCTEEAAGVYEREHRIKEGELGLAPGQNALLAGRGMCIAATAPPASQPLATVLADLTTVAPEILPVFSTLETSDADPKVHPYPTTRFKEGTLVVAVGHNDLDKVSNISPGVITEEAVDENTFTTSTADLQPGSFIVLMENPSRLCGVVLEGGVILSCKDPWFIVNWVSHALPTVVTEDAGRYPPPLLQYINDVKRTIVKNADSVPSMRICQNIFVKNSIDDFKYFML